MVAGTILLAGLMVLVTQLMIHGTTGQWPSITLASELGLPADHIYAGAIVVDTVLRFLANEVPLWLALVFSAAVIYWLVDFADEQLGRLFGRRPRAEPGESVLSEEAAPLADGGTQA